MGSNWLSRNLQSSKLIQLALSLGCQSSNNWAWYLFQHSKDLISRPTKRLKHSLISLVIPENKMAILSKMQFSNCFSDQRSTASEMVTKALLPCQRMKVGNLNIKHSQEECMWLKDYWGVKHCLMPPYIIDLLENAFENFWETRIFISNVSIIFTRTNWIKFHYSGTLASTSHYLNGRSSWSLQNIMTASKGNSWPLTWWSKLSLRCGGRIVWNLFSNAVNWEFRVWKLILYHSTASFLNLGLGLLSIRRTQTAINPMPWSGVQGMEVADLCSLFEISTVCRMPKNSNQDFEES